MQQPTTPEPGPFRAVLPSLLFIASMFFLNFLSRVIFSPLMAAIQADLHIDHAVAGRMFLWLALGGAIGLVANGLISSRLAHKGTIALAAAAFGSLMVLASLSRSPAMLGTCMFLGGLGGGFYLPSGIATITAITQHRHWGAALAVHELAPNISSVLAPLVAEAFLALASWRAALAGLGLAQICLGLLFARRGPGKGLYGQPPKPSVLRRVTFRPAFWIMAAFFCLAVGGALGVYSMLPLYLIADHGFTRPEANQLLCLSRISCIFMAFAAGYLTDRFGAKTAIAGYFIAVCLATLCLGLAKGNLLVAAVLLQPLAAVCFFPAGFTALGSLFEAKMVSAAVSLLTPISISIGAGVVPALLGHMGNQGRFSTAFICLAALQALALLLLPALRLERKE